MEPGPQESDVTARVQMCTTWSEGSMRSTWVTPDLTPRTPPSWAPPQTHQLMSMTTWEAVTQRVASSHWPARRVASSPMTSTTPTRTVPAPGTTENTAGWITSSTATEQDRIFGTSQISHVLRHLSRTDFFCPCKWALRWQTAASLSSCKQLRIISDLVSYGRRKQKRLRVLDNLR